MDYLLKNGKVYTNGYFQDCDIGIQEGKIIYLGKATCIEAKQILDVSGKWIVPGGIDTHAHLRAPSNDKRETFLSGTMAAAAGGTTLIVEQPICDPPQYSLETLAYRNSYAQKEAVVDYAFYGAAGSQYPEKIEEIKAAGIVGYKTFLQLPPKERENEFTNLYMENDEKLYEGMKRVAQTGHFLMVHAENHLVIAALERELRKKGQQTGIAHVLSRTPYTEYESIKKIIDMAKETGTKIFFAHVSTAEGMEMIKKAKEEGQEVFCETCIHYLTLEESVLERFGAFAKCNPPIRSAKNQQKLWNYVADGTVDAIGSDHSPFLYEEKNKYMEDIFRAPAGLVGIDLRYPLMLDAAIRGKISLEDMVEVMSVRPAKMLGFFPKKGVLGVNADADLLILDLEKETVINKADSYSKSREAQVVYDGVTLKGAIEKVMLRGTFIADAGKVSEMMAGYGKWQKP